MSDITEVSVEPYFEERMKDPAFAMAFAKEMENALASCKARGDTLAAASEALHERYGDWVMQQSNEVTLKTALAFGKEYAAWVEAVAAYRKG